MRYIPHVSQEPQAKRSRYTPPSSRKALPSPRWYVGIVLGCFVVGVAIIIGNYVSGDANNLLLIIGLILILVGFLLAMRLR